MSVSLMSLVWDRAPYEGGTLLVLLALADWADDEGVTWPSMATLAGKARMQIRNTRYILRTLETDQMITRVSHGSGRATTVYRLNVEALCAMPLAWKRPGPPPPVAHREQNISAPDYVPRQNLHEALDCPPERQPIAPLTGNDCPPERQPIAPMSGNPLPPTHHRSTNEPKDPLPPDELGGGWLATQGGRREQKSTSEEAPVSPATGDQTRPVITRAERSALLKTVWREWDMADTDEPPPSDPPLDHGPAP